MLTTYGSPPGRARTDCPCITPPRPISSVLGRLGSNPGSLSGSAWAGWCNRGWPRRRAVGVASETACRRTGHTGLFRGTDCSSTALDPPLALRRSTRHRIAVRHLSAGRRRAEVAGRSAGNRAAIRSSQAHTIHSSILDLALAFSLVMRVSTVVAFSV
jgi:hypothetical protein